MNPQIFNLRQELSSRLNPMRYEHSLSVSFTCIALAMRYGCDLDQAELAGLLHDCAKRYDEKTLFKKCETHQIELSEDQIKAPAVLHAIYGTWMAEHKFGITDEKILNAVRYHSTGRPGMELLEKILYTADYIEARRDKAPALPRIRQLAFTDLDEAVYEIMKSTLSYLEGEGFFIDPMTQKAFDYYQSLRSE